MKGQVVIGLCASLAVHVAAVGLWHAQQPRAYPRASHGQEGRPMQVWLQAVPVRPAEPVAAHLAADTPDTTDTAAAAPAEASAPPTAPDAPGLATADTGALPDDGNSQGDVHPLAAATDTPVPGGLSVFQELPYIPSKELDVPPQPESAVVVPFPDAILEQTKVSGVLILFIGESGRVDRVELGESDLPPAFARAAIDTFMQSRMQPGIKDGKPSRARMKILVEFEAR